MSRGPATPPPRRWVLLGWTALLWVPLLAVGIALLVVFGSGRQAVLDYRDDRPDRAADRFTSLDGVPFERWKAPFGAGTALLADGGSANLALLQLDRALGLVPDSARCSVQTNRAEALTRVADGLNADAVQRAGWTVQLQQIEQGLADAPSDPPWGTATLDTVIAEGMDLAGRAATRYGEAATALEDPTCEDSRSGEEQQDAQDRTDDLRDRQQQSEDLSDQLDPDSSDSGSSGSADPGPDSGSGTDPSDPSTSEETPSPQEQEEQQRQQELQERNQLPDPEDLLPGGGSGTGDGSGDQDGSGGGTSQPW
ncbi:MAG TPA: hypothetical protein VGC67_17820 [Cellulomonas sp.]